MRVSMASGRRRRDEEDGQVRVPAATALPAHARPQLGPVRGRPSPTLVGCSERPELPAMRGRARQGGFGAEAALVFAGCVTDDGAKSRSATSMHARPARVLGVLAFELTRSGRSRPDHGESRSRGLPHAECCRRSKATAAPCWQLAGANSAGVIGVPLARRCGHLAGAPRRHCEIAQ